MAAVGFVLRAGGADGGKKLAADLVAEPGPLRFLVLLRPWEGDEIFVQPFVFHRALLAEKLLPGPKAARPWQESRGRT